MSERRCYDCDCLIGSGSRCGPCGRRYTYTEQTRCKGSGCEAKTGDNYCKTCRQTRYL